MFSKWPADPWMCLQTFVTAVSLSAQSHKALNVPGWSREPEPKNRLSDKELKAAVGGFGLKRGTERDFPPTHSLSLSLSPSLSRSCWLQARWPACLNLRNDSVSDNFAIATAQWCAHVLYSRLRLFDFFSVEAYSVMPSLCLCLWLNAAECIVTCGRVWRQQEEGKTWGAGSGGDWKCVWGGRLAWQYLCHRCRKWKIKMKRGERRKNARSTCQWRQRWLLSLIEN